MPPFLRTHCGPQHHGTGRTRRFEPATAQPATAYMEPAGECGVPDAVPDAHDAAEANAVATTRNAATAAAAATTVRIRRSGNVSPAGSVQSGNGFQWHGAWLQWHGAYVLTVRGGCFLCIY